MQSIFASHRGRKAKKAMYFVLALSLVSFIYGNSSGGVSGGEGEGNDNSKVTIAEAPIYKVEETESAAPGAEGTDNSTEDPEEEANSDEEKANANIEEAKNEVLTVAQDWATTWTTYDYTEPPTYNQINNLPKNPEHQKKIKPKFDELVKGITEREERSTGEIMDANVQDLKYDGSNASGSGTAIVNVTVKTTLSSKSIGTGGTEEIKKYDITVMRDEGSTGDTDSWFVSDYEDVS